jgi:hypothetical protein
MAGPYGQFVDLNNSATNIGQSTRAQGSASNEYNPRQQGVFALNPLATPKYARNRGARDAEFRDTLARIYISLADSSDAVRSAYLASLPGDQATQALAKVLLGGNSQGGSGFIDFFLTQATEPFQEIMQVDKVMSDDYVAFFYGQNPPQFQYSGMLLNSMQDDQRSGFARAYQLMLRGTQLARRGAIARLRYDSVVVSGVMMASQQQLVADNEMAVPFSFTFLVKEYVILNNPKFNKTSPADYVKIAADAAIAALGPVGTASDTRVRTTAITTPVPSAVSTAGADSITDVVNQGLNVMQQLVGLGVDKLRQPAVSSNIRGTVDPNPPTPPAAP